ncbi:hypothetical protein D3C71_2059380 [compost metagenome]
MRVFRLSRESIGGGHVDNRTLALLLHLAGDPLRHIEHAVQIHINHSSPVVILDVEK